VANNNKTFSQVVKSIGLRILETYSRVNNIPNNYLIKMEGKILEFSTGSIWNRGVSLEGGTLNICMYAPYTLS